MPNSVRQTCSTHHESEISFIAECVWMRIVHSSIAYILHSRIAPTSTPHTLFPLPIPIHSIPIHLLLLLFAMNYDEHEQLCNTIRFVYLLFRLNLHIFPTIGRMFTQARVSTRHTQK